MIISGILGHPLKNPRSIKIWKKYFKKNNIRSKMEKFDIVPKNLPKFFQFIKKERNFKATAVTMPYKKEVLKYLDDVDEFAKKAGAVNLIIKKRKKLIGYNTDLFGAFNSIKNEITKFDRIIIIGLGGTGEAIFKYLSSRYKNKEFVLISKKYKIKKKSKKIQILNKINSKILFKPALIINCSPLGSDLKKRFIKKTPIKKEFVDNINSSSFVFDIIYSPKKTIFSKICKKNKLKYLNGLKMNTLQAFRALELAFGK